MAESLCLTRESNTFDQIVPDQDDIFLDGPDGHAPPPEGSQAWYTKHVSKSSVSFTVITSENLYNYKCSRLELDI